MSMATTHDLLGFLHIWALVVGGGGGGDGGGGDGSGGGGGGGDGGYGGGGGGGGGELVHLGRALVGGGPVGWGLGRES